MGSPYLLSGLVKCRSCSRAMSGQDSKGGKFAYYVCQSLMKRGSGACDCPRLNARRFEEMVVGRFGRTCSPRPTSGNWLSWWTRR